MGIAAFPTGEVAPGERRPDPSGKLVKGRQIFA
jgi:hypothetical protein